MDWAKQEHRAGRTRGPDLGVFCFLRRVYTEDVFASCPFPVYLGERAGTYTRREEGKLGELGTQTDEWGDGLSRAQGQ